MSKWYVKYYCLIWILSIPVANGLGTERKTFQTGRRTWKKDKENMDKKYKLQYFWIYTVLVDMMEHWQKLCWVTLGHDWDFSFAEMSFFHLTFIFQFPCVSCTFTITILERPSQFRCHHGKSTVFHLTPAFYSHFVSLL